MYPLVIFFVLLLCLAIISLYFNFLENKTLYLTYDEFININKPIEFLKQPEVCNTNCFISVDVEEDFNLKLEGDNIYYVTLPTLSLTKVNTYSITNNSNTEKNIICRDYLIENGIKSKYLVLQPNSSISFLKDEHWIVINKNKNILS